ncbi:hypothetical protein QCA50_009154 [Cerrena zonata]|uniref:NDT80 domain-containing protein n=1 Tax=Cerrena zonata TaxID=2478898 RepID=A0AAW0G9X3_9APHY
MFTHRPSAQMTSSPRVQSSVSPVPHTGTPRSESASASPQWSNTSQFISDGNLDISNFINNSPYMPCVDPYLDDGAVYNSSQSGSPSPYPGETFYQPSQTLPANSLLLSPAAPYGTNSNMNMNTFYGLESHNHHGHSASQRPSPIPHIRIDTQFTSPPLTGANVSTPNHSSSALSAYSTSPPSGHKSPYTPPSISPASNTLIIDPGHHSPHSPTSLMHYGGQAMSPTPKSPYAPHTYTPSPTSSISAFGDMTLATHMDFPRNHVPHAPQMPRTVQPVPSVYDLAKMFPGFNHMVPQKTYRPNTQSDRRRYVEEVQLEQPIMFYVSGPDGLGISCRDALSSRFIRLRDRDDQMFINRGPSVSIRVQWPGYPAWSRQIPTRDFRTPPGPITRAKLAKNVAKTVDRFIIENSQKPMEDDADSRWRVGNDHISVDRLEIVGLQHVSMGSWQVHLRLRPAM